MIKGLVSLFTSGLIFNPMVLLGVGGGLYSVTHLEAEQIKNILSDYQCYLWVMLIALLYVMLFRKAYKGEGMELDYTLMCLRVIAETAKCLLAFVLSMSFVVLISF